MGKARGIREWLTDTNSVAKALRQHLSQWKDLNALFSEELVKEKFSRNVPVVIATESKATTRFLSSGPELAKKILREDVPDGSERYRFVSFLSDNTPPLHLGNIREMKAAGLDDYFMSSLLRLDDFTGDDSDALLEIQLLYVAIAQESPQAKQIQFFKGLLQKDYTKPELATALDELFISATRLKSPALVEVLSREGASPNARSWIHGVTALSVAESFHRKETVDLLIAAGADPNRPVCYPMSETPIPPKKKGT